MKTVKNMTITIFLVVGIVLVSVQFAEAAEHSTPVVEVPQTSPSTDALVHLQLRASEIDARLQAVQKRLAQPAPFWTGATIVGLVAVLSAALSGFLVARFTARWNADASKAARLEEHVFNSLQWLSGGTQKRSIGIAVIDANWTTLPNLHETWTSVLVAQAVYLLAQKGRKKTTQHELTNANSILRILQKKDVRLDNNRVTELERALKAREFVFRLVDASVDKTEDQVTREFETKKKDSEVLIVRAAGDSEKLTVAGFSDKGEFLTVAVDDSSNDLSKELRKEPIDEDRIVELTTSIIDRTQNGLDLPEEALRQWRDFVGCARQKIATA